MATVSNTLRMKDSMGSVLKSVITSMNLTISTMEKLNISSDKIDLGSSFENAKQQIGLATVQLDRIDDEIAKAAKEQDKFNNKIRDGTGFANGLKTMFASVGGAMAIKKIVGMSDEWTQSTARLNLIVDDGGSVEELQKKIYTSAQSSRGLYTDMATSVSKLGLLAKDSFNNTDEIIKFTETFQKMGTISGSSASEMSNAMYQLNQAMASGRLQGDEYRSIIENTPMLAQAISSYMGVGQDELKKLASEGKITSSIIKGAMFSVSNEVDAKFEQMPMTWGQVWNNITNNILMYSQPILEFINLLANNWSILEPIVLGVVSVLGAYLAIMLLVNVIQGISAIGTAIHTAFRKEDTKTTFAQTLAQQELNKALLSCPLTWIMLLIVALIVVFAIFTEQIMGGIYWLGGLFKNIAFWIANCGIAVWEVIKNIGLWFANLGLSIWAVIKNVGLWFANLGLGIWEVLKACAHNVKAAFVNTWKEVQIKFWGFIEAVLTGVEQISGKINSLLGVFGVEIDTTGISNEIEKLAQKQSDLEKEKLEYKDIGDAWEKGSNTYKYESVSEAYNTNVLDWSKVSDGFNTFDPFQKGWGSDSYNQGAKVGKNIKNLLGDKFSLYDGKDDKNDDKNDALSSEDLGSVLDDQEYDVNVKDDVNLANESLKYLLDEVTQKYINNINLQAPAPNVSVKIDVASGADLDLDELAEKTKQKIGIEMVEFSMSSTDIVH